MSISWSLASAARSVMSSDRTAASRDCTSATWESSDEISPESRPMLADRPACRLRSWPSCELSWLMLAARAVPLVEIAATTSPPPSAASAAKPASRSRMGTVLERRPIVILCACGVSCRARAGVALHGQQTAIRPERLGSPASPRAGGELGDRQPIRSRPLVSCNRALAPVPGPRRRDSGQGSCDADRVRPHLRRHLAGGAPRWWCRAPRHATIGRSRGTGSCGPTARSRRARASERCSRPRAFRSVANGSTCGWRGCRRISDVDSARDPARAAAARVSTS